MKKMLDRIIEVTNTKVTINHKQYIAYKNNELTLSEIKFINKLDDALPNILHDPMMEKCFVVAIAYGMHIITNPVVVFAEELSDPLAPVDALGAKMLSVAQRVCYWVCIIMGVKDIIKELMKGDVIHNPSDIVKVFIQYTLAFASVYLLPAVFDMIKKSF